LSTAPLEPTSCPMPLATTPIASPPSSEPVTQPATGPRCSRQASPTGPDSPRAASGRPGRGCTRPAPRSRRADGKARTSQRSAANGRVSSAQPTGESHVSQDSPCRPPESPIARSRNVTPSTEIASPLAPRAVPLTCAAIAASPAKTRPQPASASPKATAPPAGSPLKVSTATASTATMRFAIAAMPAATDSAAFRPTTAEPTSSSRPVSSSALVCRTTRKMLIRPAPRAA
jgi:hypothetical protein